MKVRFKSQKTVAMKEANETLIDLLTAASIRRKAACGSKASRLLVIIVLYFCHKGPRINAFRSRVHVRSAAMVYLHGIQFVPGGAYSPYNY